MKVGDQRPSRIDPLSAHNTTIPQYHNINAYPAKQQHRAHSDQPRCVGRKPGTVHCAFFVFSRGHIQHSRPAYIPATLNGSQITVWITPFRRCSRNSLVYILPFPRAVIAVLHIYYIDGRQINGRSYSTPHSLAATRRASFRVGLVQYILSLSYLYIHILI